MLVLVLIVLNIPVYLAIGWVIFDTAEDAASTFFETIVAVLKAIFIPDFVRALTGMDTEGTWGLLPTGLFLFTCVAVVYGEYYLITTYLFPGS
jgi:hypothetical protein